MTHSHIETTKKYRKWPMDIKAKMKEVDHPPKCICRVCYKQKREELEDYSYQLALDMNYPEDNI